MAKKGQIPWPLGSSNVISPPLSLADKLDVLKTLAADVTNIAPLVALICCINNSYTLSLPLINILSTVRSYSLVAVASLSIFQPEPANPET